MTTNIPVTLSSTSLDKSIVENTPATNAETVVVEPPSTNPESTTVTVVSKRSPFGSLLTRTLPRYTGPHKVGVTDVELPIDRQSFGSFRHKMMPSANAGLSIETVLFTLFYPSDPPVGSTDRVVWFPKLGQTVDGFLKMAKRTPNFLYRSVAYPVAAAAITGTTFPATPNGPVKLPPGTEKWPLMIFSHGVGCSRLMYSAFCGEIASRGYIVAAVEHRDGTGPSSSIRTASGKVQAVDWLQWSDLEWPNLTEQPKDDTILRHEQIKCRLAEIHEVVKAIQKISKGETVAQTTLTPVKFDFGPCIDADKLIMAGHSLGGSAAVAAGGDNRFNFRSVIAFDPAMQRLEPWTASIPYPLLVVTSEEFVVQEDFLRTKKMAKLAQSSSIFTIAGTTHPSFSDIHLILPTFINKLIGLTCQPERVIDTTIQLTTAFLTGRTDAARKSATAYKDTDIPIKRPFGKPGVLYLHID